MPVTFTATPAAMAALECDKPLIAAVNGAAVGWGMELALFADIRIASEKAKFGELFVKRGLVCDVGGFYRLPAIVGPAKAAELLFTGDIFDAAEALRIGLVSQVTAHDDLMPQARALAARGKAVVWIDGGLHANEVLGAQQLIETVYQLVSRSDEETLRFLNDVIVLVAHANPDGHELVANWYMRERDPLRRSLSGIPRVYQKYVGHDNNRDFYMSTQAETININRVLYKEWFPQIVYDHHQTGPPGTVMFAPPFRDPFNYFLDPLVPVSIDLVGAAMHARFAAEGKPGVTMRTGSNDSTWRKGGLRTTA
jgi:enoyl-CoA hydratase/carnithine racemase